MPAKMHVGRNSTIGSDCVLYSCHIGDDVVIGDKCVILEGAVIENGAQLAPNSVVPPGRLIPAKQMWGGNPCEYIKDVNVAEHWANYSRSDVNHFLSDVHKNEFTTWSSAYLDRPSTADDLAFNIDSTSHALTS